jgi:hypothetical protein
MLWLPVILLGLLLTIWALAWRTQPQFALGMLLGVGLAWLAVLNFRPYLTGTEEMPVWLPPLPIATVAIVLLIYGIVVWLRGDIPIDQKNSDQHTSHHY